MLTEVGEEELVTASLNLRLAWLVWKKVLANRKKLESVATLLVNQIITNHKYFPSEIKYVVN